MYRVETEADYYLARQAVRFMEQNWREDDPVVQQWQPFVAAERASDKAGMLRAYASALYPRVAQKNQREQFLLEVLDDNGALTPDGEQALLEARQDYEADLGEAFAQVQQGWNVRQGEILRFGDELDAAFDALDLGGTRLSAGDKARLTTFVLSGEAAGSASLTRLMKAGAAAAAEELTWRHPVLRARRIEALTKAAAEKAVSEYVERERRPRG